MKTLYVPADDPKKVEHLRSLDGAKERLHLFPANLLEEGSFDAAVEGCEGVFHTASPFYHDVKDPQVQVLIHLSLCFIYCMLLIKHCKEVGCRPFL